MTKNKQKYFFNKEAILIIFILGVVFGALGLLREFSLGYFCGGFVFGAYISFAGLPYFDSKKWKPMPWTCAVLGMLGGLGFAYIMDRPTTHIGALAIGGFIFGYFAPYWAKHI